MPCGWTCCHLLAPPSHPPILASQSSWKRNPILSHILHILLSPHPPPPLSRPNVNPSLMVNTNSLYCVLSHFNTYRTQTSCFDLLIFGVFWCTVCTLLAFLTSLITSKLTTYLLSVIVLHLCLCPSSLYFCLCVCTCVYSVSYLCVCVFSFVFFCLFFFSFTYFPPYSFSLLLYNLHLSFPVWVLGVSLCLHFLRFPQWLLFGYMVLFCLFCHHYACVYSLTASYTLLIYIWQFCLFTYFSLLLL